MERRKLTAEELSDRLESLNGWAADRERIVRRFDFKNFAESLEYVNKVGAIAEDADHHPDITFGWGYAEISLTTHDRSGLTDLDLDLARRINSLIADQAGS